MGFFPPLQRPKVAFRDLVSFTKRAEREHVIGFTLSLLATGIILVLIFVDSQVNTSPGRSVTYVEIYDSNRTDEEIMARQQADQAAIEERARARQEEFQQIDNALEEIGL